jgi:hypothetical protein
VGNVINVDRLAGILGCKGSSIVDGLVGILGCKDSSIPLKYLGLLLGVFYKSKAIWCVFIEKVEWRLSGWKMMYLSKGGRITLIKSTISNFQFAYVFHVPLPSPCRCCKPY